MPRDSRDALLEITLAAACELVAKRPQTRAVHVVTGRDSRSALKIPDHEGERHQSVVSVVRDSDGITIFKKEPDGQVGVPQSFHRRTAWHRFLAFLIPF